jgi:propanol-preferring alcohol dehydrogenase
MKAMVLNKLCNVLEQNTPLALTDLPAPITGERDIFIKVSACGVCHTELDEIEGRTPPLRLPVIPGHQVVGRVEETGGEASRFQPGDCVGVAWIYSTCGKCKFCLEGNENLCADFEATGRDVNGGYSEYMTVPEAFAYPGATPVRRSNRLPVVKIDRLKRRTDPRIDRIRSIGTPRAYDGETSVSQRQYVRLRPE